MTRFVIDALAAVRIAREGVDVARHQLVAPQVLRSQALSIVYDEFRNGDIDATEARRILEGITTTKVRLLGDRVSRGTAWNLAVKNGWSDTTDAEYVAVTQLQADALVALDGALRDKAAGIVELADFGALSA